MRTRSKSANSARGNDDNDNDGSPSSFTRVKANNPNLVEVFEKKADDDDDGHGNEDVLFSVSDIDSNDDAGENVGWTYQPRFHRRSRDDDDDGRVAQDELNIPYGRHRSPKMARTTTHDFIGMKEGGPGQTGSDGGDDEPVPSFDIDFMAGKQALERQVRDLTGPVINFVSSVAVKTGTSAERMMINERAPLVNMDAQTPAELMEGSKVPAEFLSVVLARVINKQSDELFARHERWAEELLQRAERQADDLIARAQSQAMQDAEGMKAAVDTVYRQALWALGEATSTFARQETRFRDAESQAASRREAAQADAERLLKQAREDAERLRTQAQEDTARARANIQDERQVVSQLVALANQVRQDLEEIRELVAQTVKSKDGGTSPSSPKGERRGDDSRESTDDVKARIPDMLTRAHLHLESRIEAIGNTVGGSGAQVPSLTVQLSQQLRQASLAARGATMGTADGVVQWDLLPERMGMALIRPEVLTSMETALEDIRRLGGGQAQFELWDLITSEAVRHQFAGMVASLLNQTPSEMQYPSYTRSFRNNGAVTGARVSSGVMSQMRQNQRYHKHLEWFKYVHYVADTEKSDGKLVGKDKFDRAKEEVQTHQKETLKKAMDNMESSVETIKQDIGGTNKGAFIRAMEQVRRAASARTTRAQQYRANPSLQDAKTAMDQAVSAYNAAVNNLRQNAVNPLQRALSLDAVKLLRLINYCDERRLVQAGNSVSLQQLGLYVAEALEGVNESLSRMVSLDRLDQQSVAQTTLWDASEALANALRELRVAERLRGQVVEALSELGNSADGAMPQRRRRGKLVYDRPSREQLGQTPLRDYSSPSFQFAAY